MEGFWGVLMGPRVPKGAGAASLGWPFVRSVHGAGSSPRQASHFFLLAQKEVTKKEGLTSTRASARQGFRHGVFITPAFSIPRTVGHQIGT